MLRCIEYITAIETVRTKIPLLTFSKEEDLHLQVTHYRRRGDAEWLPLFHPRPLVSRVETDEEGNEYRAYWGEIYWFERADQKPWLVHSSKIFPDKLNTRDFEIQQEHRTVDNLVGHGRFLFSFVAPETAIVIAFAAS